jgi:putative protease
MKETVELLAPAGDWDAFLAAVENGADAVYLGGRLFNARQHAGNFDTETLKKALEYAHIRDVRVYLTMNILIQDSEMERALDFAAKAYVLGADGIIVQDLGLASLLRQAIPDFPLHASTQMTIYDINGVRQLERLGFKRVVTARELTLSEIEEISRNTSLEVEIFVHGALCVCYSGQCLMSSIIGGRSGNRGKCAQPCRLPYELAGGGGLKYFLSPKDLCTVDSLKQIIGSGVKSLKIEGRMKSAEYVAVAVKIYRKYLDIALSTDSTQCGDLNIEEQDEMRLKQIFNRGGFTKGYFYGEKGKEMMCYEKPKNWGIHIGKTIGGINKRNTVQIKLTGKLFIGDGIEIWNGENTCPGTVVSSMKRNGQSVKYAGAGDTVEVGYLKGRVFAGSMVFKTSDKALSEEAKLSFSGAGNKKIPLSCSMKIKKGFPAIIVINDGAGNKAEIAGDVPEEAISVPLDKQRVIEQLDKTGSTPFEFRRIEVELDEGITIPVSKLNSMRREALELMAKKRAEHYKREMPAEYVENKKRLLYFPGNSREKEKNLSGKYVKLSLLFLKEEKIEACAGLDVDRIYLPFALLGSEGFIRRAESLREEGKEVFLWLPAVTRGRYGKIIANNLVLLENSPISGILIGNIGTIEYFKNLKGLKVIGDYSINTFNKITVKQLIGMGLDGVTLSPEMTLKQIKNLDLNCESDIELEVYGRQRLMITENCIPGNAAECGGRGICRDLAGIGEEFKLKDRKGIEFPVMCDRTDCRSTILNSSVMFVPGQLEEIKNSGVNIARLCIYDEKWEDIEEIVRLHKSLLNNGEDAAGKYENAIEKIKSKGFNKGHLLRGV